MDEEIISTTHGELSRAFTEWSDRVARDPDGPGFTSQAAEDIGKESATYLIGLIKELR